MLSMQAVESVYFCRLFDSIDTCHNFTFITVEIISPMIWCTVKAPNMVQRHLSLLAFIVYNKKQTNLKNCAKPNKEFIILYLHGVQNEKNIFAISSNFELKCTAPMFYDNKNSPLTLRTFCKISNNFSLMNYFSKIYQGK